MFHMYDYLVKKLRLMCQTHKMNQLPILITRKMFSKLPKEIAKTFSHLHDRHDQSTSETSGPTPTHR